MKLSFGLMLGLCLALAIDGWVEVRRQVEVYETDMQRDMLVQGRAIAAAVGKLWLTYGENGAIEVLRAANEATGSMHARWVSLAVLARNLETTPLADADFETLREGKSVVHIAY